MDDKTTLMARGLTHMIFRNGAVENLHVTEEPLTDENMKTLNKDVFNRIYSLLKMEPSEVEKLALLNGALFGQEWDEPEVVEFMEGTL